MIYMVYIFNIYIYTHIYYYIYIIYIYIYIYILSVCKNKQLGSFHAAVLNIFYEKANKLPSNIYQMFMFMSSTE